MGGKNENTGWQLSKMYAVKNIWMYSHLSFYLLDPDTKDQACQRYSSQENEKKVGPYSIGHDRELTGTFPTANTAGTFCMSLNCMTHASFVCDFYDEENEPSCILY